MLPGLDGFEALKAIRSDSDVPVLMLTARGEEADRIVGLEMGADDYLPKTSSTRELLARLPAIMRRAHSPSPTRSEEQETVVGSLRINPGARAVVRRPCPDLSALERTLRGSVWRSVTAHNRESGGLKISLYLARLQDSSPPL